MSKKVENKLKEEVKLEVTKDSVVGMGDNNPSQKFEVYQPKVKAPKVEQPAGNTTRAFRQ